MSAHLYSRTTLALALAATLAAFGCDDPQSVRQSALQNPIDFTYACEGETATTAPVIDETAAAFNNTRICADLATGRQGALFGLILNRFPATVTLSQLNPATGVRQFLDADFFTPGTTGIPVGSEPVRILRSGDWSHFYVLSAGGTRVDRITINGLSGSAYSFETTFAALPGTPLDGVVLGDSLVIVPRDAAELWVMRTDGTTDWSVTAPSFTRIPLPDQVLEINTLDDDLLINWRHRPVLSRISIDGTIQEEVGLAPQCRDGLDNDKDGLVDLADGDCLNGADADESPIKGVARPALPPIFAGSFAGATSCDNGIDDNGDGLTDAEDPACGGDDADAESLPACANGIDDDGDGLTDSDDGQCTSDEVSSEGPAPVDGPFSTTFVDGGAAGRFVYVLDARLGQILVFQYSDSRLTRVDVHAEAGLAPDLLSVPFDTPSAEPTVTTALPAIRQPAYALAGHRNIPILSGNPFKLSSSRVRGELWERLIPGASVPRNILSTLWKPAVCDPESPADQCAQPAADDASWVVYGAALDGRIQLIEAIRRGEPMHRLFQRQLDASRRIHDISAPRMTRRGTLISSRGQASPGFPFIGAAAQEVLVDAVTSESPARLRRYGIWPADDFEEAPTESWALTYEGVIPGTRAYSGRFADAATFFDVNQRFCELGVQPGDWLQLQVPTTSSDPSLHTTSVVALADGRVCPLLALTTALVEVQVTAVGMATLSVDPTTARLRAQRPSLDDDAVRAANLSTRLCQQAIDALDATLQIPENLIAFEGFSPALVPARLSYRVRPDETWVAVGSVSGFMHRQAWDRTTSQCTTDDGLDPRLESRFHDVAGAVERYDQCPPTTESLLIDRVETLAAGATRFTNPSFSLYLFPACSTAPDGTFKATPTQQETAFTFTVTGPQAGSALSVSDSMLLARVPLLESRRHQVQLDAGRNRLSILQLRFGDLKEITTLE